MSRRKLPRIFVTDCEGPISKNDNAFESTSHYIPEGGKIYALISKYDDVLAAVLRRQGYKAGDTLKLILPFLKAYGVTDEKMLDFSSKDIKLIAGAKETMRFLQGTMPSYIVSTSYWHYIFALCKAIGFPEENTYSTMVKLDEYPVKPQEIETLKNEAQEIAKMPMIKIPQHAKLLDTFSVRDQATIRRLDEIFWREIPRMPIGKILENVNPVGGSEKALAVEQIVEKYDCSLGCVLYVGDSITDVECFRCVKDGGGLAVSFNGNEYAIGEAQIAVMSEDTIVTSVVADVYNRHGKDTVFRLAEDWSFAALERFGVNPVLRKRVEQLYPRSLPKVTVITDGNREQVLKESVAFRKTVRGEAIAKLG